jgi:hypothetical protein
MNRLFNTGLVPKEESPPSDRVSTNVDHVEPGEAVRVKTALHGPDVPGASVPVDVPLEEAEELLFQAGRTNKVGEGHLHRPSPK